MRILLLLLPCLCACSSPVASDEPRFLALGDSYTIGEGVPATDRWTHHLAQALGVPEPETIARTGWTTDELRAAIDRARPRGPYDLVTLLAGVNDEFRGRDLDSFRREFESLVALAVALAGERPARVVVLTIPDWGVTPFAARVGREPAEIAARIDRFNDVVRDAAGRAGTRLVDVTAISRRAAEDRDLVAADGLHPSARMYALWSEAARAEARAALDAR